MKFTAYFLMAVMSSVIAFLFLTLTRLSEVKGLAALPADSSRFAEVMRWKYFGVEGGKDEF